MGCCISKPQPQPQPNNTGGVGVQDKLVISHQSSPPPQKTKTIQSPPSVSFTCSNQTISSSLSSASSASSITFSKTFSNDFLQSCVLENPQIVGLDPIKKIGVVKQSHKRPRAASPTLTRQKSFRIEKERLPNGRIRSPSPSRRRFNQNNYQRQPLMLNTSNRRVIKENTRPPSPNRNVICNQTPMFVKNEERYGSKVEGVEVVSRMSYSAAMEDLDNPHIALDCFIFL
ncbi:hypothetical protein R6Q57_001444 [Mikania cordata]